MQRVLRPLGFMLCSVAGLCLSGVVPASPQPPTAITSDAARQYPVNGRVVNAEGKPISGARLFFSGWNNEDKDAFAQNVVTTGADGGFVWKHTGFPYAASASVPGVQVLPASSGWQLTPIDFSDLTKSSSRIRSRYSELLRPASAHWINNRGYAEGHPTPNTGTLIVEMPVTGTVKISPRGPDGKHYPDRAVQLWPLDEWGEKSQDYCWQGRTDMRGDALLPQFETEKDHQQPMPFRVVLPGIGYGTTSHFAVKTGQTTIAAVAPLAPLVNVSGTVESALRKPGQVVRLGRISESAPDAPWSWRQAPVAADGRWTLPDVTTGRHTVYLFDRESDALTWESNALYRSAQTFTVSGGRTPEVLVLGPRLTPPATPSYTQPQKVEATLSGQVRNADGSPANDAEVWGVYSEFGIRESIFTLHAKTDTNGRYRLTGMPFWKEGTPSPNSPTQSVTLLATRADTAPILAFATVDAEESHAPELTFGREEATVIVGVQDTEGKPVAGVHVQARADIFQKLANQFAQRSEVSKDLHGLLVPQAITDSKGNATFTHLRPDRYLVSASRPTPKPSPPYGDYGPGSSSAYAQGVAVSAGQEARHLLRLLPYRPPLHLRFLLPDGTPIRSNTFSYQVSPSYTNLRRAYSGSWSSSNEQDYLEMSFTPGVWHVSSRLHPDPPYVPTNDGPLLTWQTTITDSPRRTEVRTIDIHLKRQEAARLKVTIVDEAGHPVAGVVYKSNYDPFPNNGQEAAGASDKQGLLSLESGSAESITLRAEANGDAALPEFTAKDTPFPNDATLGNRRRWPAVTLSAELGKSAPVRLQAARIGWVRGHVVGAPNVTLDSLWEQQRTWGTGARYDTRTGEYLVGPLPPGQVTLSFNGKTGSKDEIIMVEPGQVTHHDITLDPTLADRWKRREEEEQRLAKLPVLVVDADHRPIPGAHVILLNVRGYGIGGSRITDDAGQAQPAPLPWTQDWPLPYRYDDDGPRPAQKPEAPRWIAFVPGSRGVGTVSAAFGNPTAPLQIVLPPSIVAAGVVTVGGKPLAQTPGNVVLYARADDTTRLVDYLSVATQPSADGTFALRGLTPGRYTVQAALDSTYFSPPQTLVVAANNASVALTLAIEAPGAPTILDLGASGALGRVYPVETVSGPLAERMATRFWAADGAGVVRLEGLSAGAHRLRLPDGKIQTVQIVAEP